MSSGRVMWSVCVTSSWIHRCWNRMVCLRHLPPVCAGPGSSRAPSLTSRDSASFFRSREGDTYHTCHMNTSSFGGGGVVVVVRGGLSHSSCWPVTHSVSRADLSRSCPISPEPGFQACPPCLAPVPGSNRHAFSMWV